jgi:hypothetical protein
MKINKILIASICIFSTLLLSGCGKSNIDSNKPDYESVEIYNMKNDTYLHQEIVNTYKTDYQKAKSTKDKNIVTLKYLNDVYELANDRYTLDIEVLPVYSEEYKVYVAMMQVYSNTYVKEKEELMKNNKIYDLDYIRKNTDTGYMLSHIEDTMNMFSQSINGGE